MADERGDFTVGTGEGDALVDTTGEVRNPVFKEVVGDLHDIYGKTEREELVTCYPERRGACISKNGKMARGSNKYKSWENKG